LLKALNQSFAQNYYFYNILLKKPVRWKQEKEEKNIYLDH